MTQLIPFPEIKPTSRSYTPGNYPQTQFQAQNGSTTVIRFGSRRVDAKLSLGFSNVTDDEAASILSNYESVNSAWNVVTFSAANGSAGAGSALAAYLQESGASGLRWRYSAPPQVQSVYPGVSSVSCQFVAVLDGN